MKATITYNCKNRDQEMALQRAMKSTDMAIVLFEISNNLKRQAEWKQDENSDVDMVKWMFEQIDDLMDEHGIIIDDLIQ
jgi:hypothetical protein